MKTEAENETIHMVSIHYHSDDGLRDAVIEAAAVEAAGRGWDNSGNRYASEDQHLRWDCKSEGEAKVLKLSLALSKELHGVEIRSETFS